LTVEVVIASTVGITKIPRGDIRRAITYATGLECIPSVQRLEHHQQTHKRQKLVYDNARQVSKEYQPQKIRECLARLGLKMSRQHKNYAMNLV